MRELKLSCRAVKGDWIKVGVHRAFLAIDEYRRRISPDIAGAAP